MLLKTLTKLADGSKRNVISWRRYDINKYSFYTKSQDDKSVQNNGVNLMVKSQHFASVHDDNPHVAFIPYFGFIEEIWELNYVKFIVFVFKYKWVDSNIDVWTDDFEFTLVDLKKLAYQNESMSLSLLQNKLNMYFIFKILVMKGGQWFYTKKSSSFG